MSAFKKKTLFLFPRGRLLIFPEQGQIKLLIFPRRILRGDAKIIFGLRNRLREKGLAYLRVFIGCEERVMIFEKLSFGLALLNLSKPHF